MNLNSERPTAHRIARHKGAPRIFWYGSPDGPCNYEFEPFKRVLFGPNFDNCPQEPFLIEFVTEDSFLIQEESSEFDLDEPYTFD